MFILFELSSNSKYLVESRADTLRACVCMQIGNNSLIGDASFWAYYLISPSKRTNKKTTLHTHGHCACSPKPLFPPPKSSQANNRILSYETFSQSTSSSFFYVFFVSAATTSCGLYAYCSVRQGSTLLDDHHMFDNMFMLYFHH